MSSLKLLRKLGFIYLAISLGITTVYVLTPKLVQSATTPRHFSSNAHKWYQSMKPYCNNLELDVRLRKNPAPKGWLGEAYKATCFAIAGQMKRAELTIDSLDDNLRYKAAGVIFSIGHPIADAGDDRSAGAIMGLVIKYQPNNYMALYHAGMSEYLLGRFEVSKVHLKRFLELYRRNDYWNNNARKVLSAINSGKKLSSEEVKSYASH